MPLLRSSIASASLVAATIGALAQQPAVPTTMIDALGRVREAGWHGVELGDRRSVAVYRTRSGAMMAFGCRPDGALVIGGREARILSLVQEGSSTVVALPQDRVAARGASFALNALVQARDSGQRANIDGEAVSREGAEPLLQRVSEQCQQRRTRGERAENDQLWTGTLGDVAFGDPAGTAVLRLQCDTPSRRLTLVLSGLPPRLAEGETPSIVVATPNRRLAQAATPTAAEAPAERSMQAVVQGGAALLGELSSEEGFAVGFGTTAAMSLAHVIPAQGLGGLIERYLGPCR